MFLNGLKHAIKWLAEVFNPQNMVDLIAKVVEDLRVAISESSSASGRFLLSIPLIVFCMVLYVAKAIKWFLRIFHRLGVIAIAEVEFHTGFLARASTRLKTGWAELQEALLNKVIDLWDDIWGKSEAEHTPQVQGEVSIWKLTGRAVTYTCRWVPRLLEATLAIVWVLGALGGLLFVLLARRKFPLEIFGASAFLTFPPLIQHGIRARAFFHHDHATQDLPNRLNY